MTEPTAREWKGYYFCLDHARRHGHGPTMEALAAHLEIHQNNACNVAAALERKGLIVRAGKSWQKMKVLEKENHYRLKEQQAVEDYAAAVAETVLRI
jgi:predicted transcriptional regulator of viral defense system